MASTAMIQHEIDVPLHKLIKLVGRKSAERIWRRSAQAVSDLVDQVDELGIRCQMQRKQTLFLTGDDLGSRAIKTEYDARIKAGLAVRLLGTDELKTEYGIARNAALLSDMSASANPAQLTAGLLRDAQRKNTEIVSGTEISDLRQIGDEVVLATKDGCLITVDHVVFCTGYEFLKSLASTQHEIVSTWAIATKPHVKLPAWLKHHLVWEGANPYLYFRTTRDGRLIAGGEDERSADAFQSPDLLRTKTKLIAEKIADLLGCNIGAPEFRWAGAFGTTKTGLPMIGEVPGFKRVYAVMGFGGNGITFSKIAADIVSASIRGYEDPDRKLFGFRPG